MARVTGTKIFPVDGDTLIIKDSEDANRLKEIAVSNLSINNISETADVAGVKTYTIWRDVAQTVAVGTFNVTEGTNGTGASAIDYQAGTTYPLHELTMHLGILYRSTVVDTLGSSPELLVEWEEVTLGGGSFVHDPTAAYAIGDIVMVNGRMFTPNRNISASAGTPFVEGVGTDEWYNAVVGVYPLWDINEDTPINAVRRHAGLLYQANSAMTGATVPIAFATGSGVDTWRVLGAANSLVPVFDVANLINTGGLVSYLDVTYRALRNHEVTQVWIPDNWTTDLETDYDIWHVDNGYNQGALSMFEGVMYRSLRGNAPGAGWDSDEWTADVDSDFIFLETAYIFPTNGVSSWPLMRRGGWLTWTKISGSTGQFVWRSPELITLSPDNVYFQVTTADAIAGLISTISYSANGFQVAQTNSAGTFTSAYCYLTIHVKLSAIIPIYTI